MMTPGIVVSANEVDGRPTGRTADASRRNEAWLEVKSSESEGAGRCASVRQLIMRPSVGESLPSGGDGGRAGDEQEERVGALLVLESLELAQVGDRTRVAVWSVVIGNTIAHVAGRSVVERKRR